MLGFWYPDEKLYQEMVPRIHSAIPFGCRVHAETRLNLQLQQVACRGTNVGEGNEEDLVSPNFRVVYPFSQLCYTIIVTISNVLAVNGMFGALYPGNYWIMPMFGRNMSDGKVW